MQNDYLKHFYEQENVRKAVKDYFLQVVDEQVLESAYKDGNVSGYKEAREVIEGVFNGLRNSYETTKESSKENKAR